MNASAANPHLISFGLNGRVCLVTGGSQGIGEACCRRFAREGAKVVIADMDDARGGALASELGGLYVHCDVGDKAQVDALVAAAITADSAVLDDIEAQASGKMDKMKAEMGAVAKKKPESPAEKSMPQGGENMNFEKKVAEMESKAKAEAPPTAGGGM